MNIRKSQQKKINRRHKKELNGYFRVEKYNNLNKKLSKWS